MELELTNFLQSAIRFTIPILFVALGETLSEKSGVMNLGVEGIMLVGAFSGFAFTSYTGSNYMGALGAILMGALFGLAFALFCVTLRSNQIIVGTAFNLLCVGATGFLYRRLFTDLNRESVVMTFPFIGIPILKDIPIIGPVLFNENILFYFAILCVAIMWFVFYKTSLGLSIIATGEHPKAADSLGINVYLVRYSCIIAGGALAALGGAFLSIAHSNTFIEGMSSGRGFIALAVVILGKWNPLGALAGAFLFGAASSLQLSIQSAGNIIPYDLVLMLPYILTIVAVVLVSKHINVSPTALGIPYEK